MAKGKKTPFGMFCSKTKQLLGVVWLLKARNKPKEYFKRPIKKYSPKIREHVAVDFKEIKKGS